MMFFKLLFIYFFCTSFNIGYLNLKANSTYNDNCFLPERCHLQKIYTSNLFWESNDKGESYSRHIICEINDETFEFNFKEPMSFKAGKKCPDNNKIGKVENIILRWTNSKELSILDNRLNISNVIRYNRYFERAKDVKLWNLKGFDINILDDFNAYAVFEEFNSNSDEYLQLFCSNCRFDFYHNRRKMNSCQDIDKSNITRIYSIFQIKIEWIFFKNMEFQEKICPIIFVNSTIDNLVIYNLIDSFYKKNILSISNETYTELNSTIYSLELYNVQNINLDLNLLNPFVFNKTTDIMITSGSLNSIDREIFRHLKNIKHFGIDRTIFRKINHKQGIEWIRQFNSDVNVNIRNISNNFIKFKTIRLSSSKFSSNQRKRTSKILPDEDFCIYRDFPFNQYVIIHEFIFIYFSSYTYEFTCTYLWLIQYFENYYENYKYQKNNCYYRSFPYIVKEVIENTTALESIPKCEFEKRLTNCNKSNYQIKDIWDESDFFLLNKKIQIFFKIAIYQVSLFGLITNFIVVLVIVKKENSDLFKEFKQYNYLYLNSIFCMFISVIELLSWMTECFYPFEVFCPEIRKLIAIQFFKIIFTECFITLFRFMCNFTYVAFALNRISLIGKDHGKLVTFMSKIGVKKYIGITLLISSIFSWIKGFKYEVNYFYPDPYFPLPIEFNLFENKIVHSTFRDFIMIFISISDLVNYLVFVVICIVIDICMVVKLRRTLNEKAKKSESLNQKQNESKKAEFEEAVNKAIKMVVLNSVIGIVFKLPICIIPLLNAYARFYYRDEYYKFDHPRFGEFFSMLVNSGFYDLIQDVSHLLYILSLAIQLFIYKRFDKKFLIGFERLMNKTSSNGKEKSKIERSS